MSTIQPPALRLLLALVLLPLLLASLPLLVLLTWLDERPGPAGNESDRLAGRSLNTEKPAVARPIIPFTSQK